MQPFPAREPESTALPNSSQPFLMPAGNQVAPGDDSTAEVVLSEFESNSFGGLLGEGITTVSFFSGDRQAAAVFLKDRLAQVAAANPCASLGKRPL